MAAVARTLPAGCRPPMVSAAAAVGVARAVACAAGGEIGSATLSDATIAGLGALKPRDGLGEHVHMPQAPRWPAELQALAACLRDGQQSGIDAEIGGRIWLLLHGALLRFLRQHAIQLGGCCREEQEDIAAQKALLLLQRIASDAWRPGDYSPGEIAAFLSRIARNALIDWRRAAGRFVARENSDGLPAHGSAPGGSGLPGALGLAAGGAEPPDLAAERHEFVQALKECARRLQPRARTVWFFRIFYDMPSKTIACHPEVGLKPAHVDVLLQRCRAAIRECMRGKGHRPQDMPPGTFAELWMALRCEGTANPFPGGAR